MSAPAVMGLFQQIGLVPEPARVIVLTEPPESDPMAERNFENRTLFHSDNLPILRAMNSESVDLIATDPPFNKNRDFHATPDSLAAGASFQDRWSWERDVHEDWTDQITDDHPRLMEAIESARYAHSDGMGAFMCFMAVRLLAMHRVLKPTGSIYLHCDPTASHYLKAVMDAAFGWKQFVNEVVWSYNIGGRVSKRAYGRRHDILLFYAKTSDYTFNWDQVLVDWDDKGQAKFKHEDEKGKYRLIGRFLKDSPIKGHRDVSPEWERTHPELVQRYYMKSGKSQVDFWNISPINQVSPERMGYPTQKPLALYTRIIKASSNEGDMVLDPFAGCATTCVAAERLHRQWVGIDIWDKAHKVVLRRLRSEGLIADTKDKTHGHIFTEDVSYTSDAPTRTDDAVTSSPNLRTKVTMFEPRGPNMTRAAMYEHLLDQRGPKCQGCDRAFDDPRYLQLDHNTPRADGGLNHISNRVLLCGPCNGLKSHIYTLSGLRRENRKRGYMSRETT